MPINPADWVSRSHHAWVRHPSTDAEWETLIHEYGGQLSNPLQRIIEIARGHRCRTVVIENRYVDADWRNEFAAFWSGRFEMLSPFARRMHFFSAEIQDSDLHALGARVGYIGYTVLRPVTWGPVGRTVLKPPRSLKGAVLTSVRDKVSLFGNPLSVEGVPFYQQDTEFVRCAHAASWVVHYVAWRRGLVGRQGTADMFALSPKHLSYARSVPSGGMSLWQMQAVFEALKQPAIFYSVGALPEVPGSSPPVPQVDEKGDDLPNGYWDTRLFSVICRYLNSGFPVIVAGSEHALALVGWVRRGDKVRFIACDDQVGPYELIDSPFTHYKAPWHSIMVPLPPKVFVAGEAAEIATYTWIRSLGASGVTSPLTLLSNRLVANELRLRTFLLPNNRYKEDVAKRGRSESVVRALRLNQLPHYIWLVEIRDAARDDAGEPAVLADFVYDTTSQDQSPRLCAVTVPGVVMTMPPDGGEPRWAMHSDLAWSSAGRPQVV
jgi:hypothetical protein